MAKAKDLYPYEGYQYFSDYGPIVDSFGKVVVQVDDDDYQGDSRVLYHNEDGKVGYLNFGWGSCSGCDALQACNSYEDVDQLIGELESAVTWWDTKAEALAYFQSHDWEGDYSWHHKEQQDFLRQAVEYLSK